MSEPAASVTPALGAIVVSGSEAAGFLRAQLTNDVLRLGPDRHFSAAWCDAKGRALMLAQVCEYHDGYLLLVPHELIAGLIRRLRMYVLRADVVVEDASARLRVVGVQTPDLPAPGQCERRDGALVLGLPAGAGTARALAVLDASQPAPTNSMATDDNAWEQLEIDSGLPYVVAATQGLFVPQMLNLHWLQAIDFDKGCYPGQEVIARLQYRGRLTRRLFRLAWQGQAPAPGDTVFDGQGSTQGTVVRSASHNADDGVMLAVLKVGGIAGALTSADARLTLLELPYPTPDQGLT